MIDFETHGDEHRPSTTVVCGRTYQTKRQRSFVFPLKPSEVRAGQTLTVTFPTRGDYDIALQAVAVFVMPFAKIQPFQLEEEQDWMLHPQGLLDFNEDITGSGAASIASRIATAIGEAAVGEVQELIPARVKIMYCSKDFTHAARGAIIRIVKGEPGAVGLWADAL